MTVKAIFVAALLVSGLVACGESSSSDSTAPSATDDTNELNARKLQVFDCTTEKEIDGKIQKMTFSIKNITDNKKLEIFDKDGNDPEDYMPVKVTPDEGRVSALNENLSVSTGSRQLRISGDSDGFFLLDLVLYKNSGYTKGYLRIWGGDPDEVGANTYSKVSCNVTQKP